MRLIDADALHDALKAKQKWVVRCEDKHNEGYTYDQVHFAIDDAPTIEPKQGEWIDLPRKMFKCSECGQIYQVLEPKNFCSNCGCQMKGAERWSQI